MDTTLNTITSEVMLERDCLKPEDINGGSCWFWALVAYRCLNSFCNQCSLFSVTGYNGGWHIFIKYNDRYYDAECLDGVSDWHQLPIFGGAKQGLDRSNVDIKSYVNNLVSYSMLSSIIGYKNSKIIEQVANRINKYRSL